MKVTCLVPDGLLKPFFAYAEAADTQYNVIGAWQRGIWFMHLCHEQGLISPQKLRKDRKDKWQSKLAGLMH